MTDPCNVEMKSVFKVLRLRDNHQIEAPATTEVRDDDGVHWPWRQKRFPWSFQRLQRTWRHVYHVTDVHSSVKRIGAKITHRDATMASNAVDHCPKI